MKTPDRQRLQELAGRANFYKGRYRNIERTPAHGLTDFFRWQLQTGARFPPGKRFPLRHPDPHLLASPASTPRLTWLGHASFLYQYGAVSLLTDPVFSERCSPLQFVGPRRHTPVPLQVADLPPVTDVLISHNHYDHLDETTVRDLHRRFGEGLRFHVPTGVASWFHKRGINNVSELGWWQWGEERERNMTLYCLPTQHFSGRSATDRNTSLWCSWIVDIGRQRLYFAGDTGYSRDLFRQIGELFAPVDLALLPIGAYDPRWFMSPVHVAPEEAVHIHQDIGARRSVAMHWGTFVLTCEPMDEPPRRLRQALDDAGLSDEDFMVFQHGETREFPE